MSFLFSFIKELSSPAPDYIIKEKERKTGAW